MEQSVSGHPERKLPRQLDFTAMCRATVNAMLPEHPQAQLQSKLLALAKAHAQALPTQSQLQSPPQLQPQQRSEQLMPLTPRVAHPVKPPARPTLPIVATKSPKSRQSGRIEVRDGTPKRKKPCNCRNSRCLKLYCECFASGFYCDGCNCTNCHNGIEHDPARQEAVGAILERNPHAFRPKIANSPSKTQDSKEKAVEFAVMAKHNKGCNCKKSGCLKKYCECFQANIRCSGNCKCMDCKNFEGSEERRSLFQGDNVTFMSYIQQARNAAICWPCGNSHLSNPAASKKRKNAIFATTTSNQSIHAIAQFHQEKHSRDSAASYFPLSAPVSCTASSTPMGSTKLTYRSPDSPLADVLPSQDVKDLCSLLVTVSAEATKGHADKKGKRDKQEGDQLKDSAVSLVQENLRKTENNRETSMFDDLLSGNQVDKADNSESNGHDVQTRRPLSPAALTLMCDEHDAMLMAAVHPDAAGSPRGNMSNDSFQGQVFTEFYADQERNVLMNFWNFLNKIITHGNIKEARCSPLDETKPGIKIEPEENVIMTTKAGMIHNKTDNTDLGKSVEQIAGVISGTGEVMCYPLAKRPKTKACSRQEAEENGVMITKVEKVHNKTEDTGLRKPVDQIAAVMSGTGAKTKAGIKQEPEENDVITTEVEKIHHKTNDTDLGKSVSAVAAEMPGTGEAMGSPSAKTKADIRQEPEENDIRTTIVEKIHNWTNEAGLGISVDRVSAEMSRIGETMFSPAGIRQAPKDNDVMTTKVEKIHHRTDNPGLGKSVDQVAAQISGTGGPLRSDMSNLDIFGPIDGDLGRTVQFLRERKVAVAIRDERELNQICQLEVSNDKSVSKASLAQRARREREREKQSIHTTHCASEQAMVSPPSTSSAANKTISKRRSLAQQARREREKVKKLTPTSMAVKKTLSKASLAQRARRQRERERQLMLDPHSAPKRPIETRPLMLFSSTVEVHPPSFNHSS